MIPGVSIILCCYNSSKRLSETLKHISLQNFASCIPCEVILVDNNSSDNTKEVAVTKWNEYKCTIAFTIVEEKIPGLSYAREKGIFTSKYEYLLFCDDDNWLAPNYVETAYELMSSNENIGALGGLGLTEFEVEPDEWIRKYQGIYATGPQSKISGEVNSYHVYGAGCLYRKSAVTNLFNNGFSYYLTGRKGKSLQAGEDHELCYALVLNGYKVWYDERLQFKHFIPIERINYDYIKKCIINFEKSSFYLTIYKTLIHHGIPRNLKKSWIWLVLNKSRFLFTDIFNFFLNKKHPFSYLILKMKINNLVFLLLNRGLYKNIRENLERSHWIKSSVN